MTEIKILPEEKTLMASVLVDAPAATLWRVWNTPEYVRQWWACEGMTMPVCENDVRVGGTYRYVGRMNGVDYGFKGTYREVEENRRLVHTETFDMFPDAEMLSIVELSEKDGKTYLENRIVYPSSDAMKGALDAGLADGERLFGPG